MLLKICYAAEVIAQNFEIMLMDLHVIYSQKRKTINELFVKLSQLIFSSTSSMNSKELKKKKIK